MSTTWTPELEATLSRLWEEGKSASDISRTMGGVFSRSAITGKARRLNLSSRSNAAKVGGGKMTGGTGKPALRWGRQSPGPRAPRAMPGAAHVADGPDGGVAFSDLKSRHCRFEVSGATDVSQYRFCGAKREAGRSYCPAHVAQSENRRDTARAQARAKKACAWARKRGYA